MGTTEQVIEGLRKVKESAPVTTHAKLDEAIEHLRKMQAEIDNTKRGKDLAFSTLAYVLDNGL